MKRKDLKELQLKTAEELKDNLKKIKLEFVKARMELHLGKIKNYRILATKRHEIAQIKTMITAKAKKETK